MSKKQEYILMIFEGEKTEQIIFDNLRQYFLNNKSNRIIYGFHCGEIYSLYNKLKNTGETIFYILKEKLKIKNPILQDIKEGQVESIYLFFDYDGHADKKSLKKLLEMLEKFNDEFENGKLFVSYPMVEALQHIKSDVNFKDTTAISQKEYKENARTNCNKDLLHFNDYTQEIWIYLIQQHIKKANFIVNGNFEYPDELLEQLEIFENQKEKYINKEDKKDKENKVAVLSGFPLMLLDYYGLDKFNETNN